MNRTFAALALVAFSAFAQSPAFEVASITPCEPGTPAPAMEHAGTTDFVSPGGRFTARATTVTFLLEWAYGIQPLQHSGGPSWLGNDRFDFVAKAAGNASEDEIRLMVQTLLTERFRLKLRHEKREISAYVISGGKQGPEFSPAKDGEIHGLRFVPQMGPDRKPAAYRISAIRYSVAQLANTFARQLGIVIVNNTGLVGEFDFTFDLTPDESRPSPMDPALLISAMREQLGFAIRSQKAPVDFYVIDGAEKVVAGN